MQLLMITIHTLLYSGVLGIEGEAGISEYV